MALQAILSPLDQWVSIFGLLRCRLRPRTSGKVIPVHLNAVLGQVSGFYRCLKDYVDYPLVCIVILDTFDDANCGFPSLLVFDGGVDISDIEDLLDSLSSDDVIIIDCESGFLGVVSPVEPEKGSGCREQTSLASTATDRNKAQNN